MHNSETHFPLDLSHFLYNAGVLGLCRILGQDEDLKEQIIENKGTNRVEIPKAALEKFSDLYIDYFVWKAKSQSVPLARIYDKYNQIDFKSALSGGTEKKEAEAQEKALENIDEFETYLKSKIIRNSFKSAYVIIENETGDKTDILSLVKSISKEKDISVKKKVYEEVLAYLDRHKRVLYMKEATYSIINRYWGGISFLHTSKNKTDFKKAIDDEFVNPVLKKLGSEPPKKSEPCFECGMAMGTKEKSSMAWINEIGVDIARKRSHFWNFNPDTLICPLCKLVYACVPAGFETINGQSIFVNTSESIESLSRFNDTVHMHKEIKSIDDVESKLYHGIAEAYSKDYTKTQEKHLPAGVQIIRRHNFNDKIEYDFKELSTPVYLVIRLAGAALESTSKMWYVPRGFETEKNGRRPLFSKVISDLNIGRSLHKEINRQLRLDDNFLSGVMAMLRIEASASVVRSGMFPMVLHDKEVIKRMKIERNRKFALTETARAEGEKIRIGYEQKAKENNEVWSEKSLHGLLYRTMNAVRVNDQKTFLDTIIRLYSSQEKRLPNIFLQSKFSDEELEFIGHGFIAGLKGAKTLNKNKDKADGSQEAVKAENN